MTRRPFPSELGDVFRRRDALAVGVGRQRLRRKDLDARVHGVRVADGSVDDFVTRCRAFAARLPDETFFSHSTATRLLGLPLPLKWERLSRLHVTVPAPRRAPHAEGLLGHSRRTVPGDVTLVRGLRVSSPARAWCEMASVLDLLDLVVLTDAVIHRRRPLATLGALAERREVGDRISRSPRLGAALGLADDRAESPPETRLRVICRWAGLPPVSTNHELVDTETGRGWRLDLAWPEVKFAIEYQGDYHRTRDQWRRDMTRRENLRLAGWTILELNADDLVDPHALARRIRAGLARSARG